MKDTKKLFQHGTLALLVPGLFDGTLPLSSLLEHGDTGIGTATYKIWNSVKYDHFAI